MCLLSYPSYPGYPHPSYQHLDLPTSYTYILCPASSYQVLSTNSVPLSGHTTRPVHGAFPLRLGFTRHEPHHLLHDRNQRSVLLEPLKRICERHIIRKHASCFHRQSAWNEARCKAYTAFHTPPKLGLWSTTQAEASGCKLQEQSHTWSCIVWCMC